MGDGISIDIDGFRELSKKIKMLSPEIKKSGAKGMLVGALMVESSAKQNIARQFHGKGELAASITHQIERVSGMAVAFQVGTNKKYAAIHEHGGTITPKNTKWLTIPFEGVQGRALDYQDTFFRWVPGQEGDKLVLYQKQGEGDPKPLFVLVKKSEIPARPFLNPALQKNKGRIIQIINDWIKRGLEHVSKK